jgi:hypothetical protein
MKVTSITPTEETLEENDYRSFLSILINDKKVFSVTDNEPEDSNLSRSFSDCYSIVDLMEKAYLAGKNGEEFIVEELTE